ncbi:MAG: DnaJ domain-containing protein [Desulfobacteraceae bacterium]|nr:DnaJ domain-containing protein [Desulfobacteraceae bacterium]
MKDYYKILDLAPSASEEQIRKAYRRLALREHPDRNPGDPAAGDRFREIAEAYGVLMDPAKRRQYDQLRAGGGAGPRPQAGGFGYSQEDILRDLFRDPRSSQVFQDLFREFERAGFRFDQRFFDQAFFGTRGGVFGGVFYWTPFGKGFPGQVRRPAPWGEIKSPPRKHSLLDSLKNLGRWAFDSLRGRPLALPGGRKGGLDLGYELKVDPALGRQGGWVQIEVARGSEREALRIRVPPRTSSGTRLRVKGKGLRRNGEAGDLYLTIRLV